MHLQTDDWGGFSVHSVLDTYDREIFCIQPFAHYLGVDEGGQQVSGVKGT